MEKSTAPVKALSASRIKTLETCSWSYWCNYHLKLPQSQNDGAKKGDVCHRVFEILLDERHKSKFNKIILKDSTNAVKSVSRIIVQYLKKNKLAVTEENLTQIDRMIMVGLKTDFFIKGAKLIAPEFKFDISNDNPSYLIRGFMDKPYMTEDKIIIDDFKSSKKKFTGEDEESNIQAMIYSLAALKLWPDKSPEVRFIFLQFPEDPIMKLAFNKNTLKGFEDYLAMIQKRVDNFSERDAKRDFAYDKQATGGEFKGKLVCGFSKSPTELKKDGTKKWHCPYKFAFNYWVAKKDGTIMSSSFDKENIKLKEGEVLESVHYDGCPRFQNSLNSFPLPVVKPSRPAVNVLDDF